MTNFARWVLLSGLFLASALLRTAAQDEPPSIYVAEGACPYEACKYGEWRAEKPVIVRELQDTSSSVVCVLHNGDKVMALGGVVRTRPGVVRVLRNQDGFKKGERFFVYTYEGEGVVKIWYKGQMSEADTLTLCNAQCINGIECYHWMQNPPDCWAIVEKSPESSWWVKVRCASGVEGWCLNDYAFCEVHGYDACPP